LPSDPLVFDPSEGDVPGLRPWIAFQQVLARSPQQAARALSACDGDPVAALRRCRLPPPHPDDVERALAALRRAGARLVPLCSPAYPWRLAQLPDPAPVLSVIGDLEALTDPSVAMVGARAASAYGLRVAHQLACELARAGLVIVSGLAHGIDAAAHAGALAAGGRTVAVQACGPDQVYPRAHRQLAGRIAASGALVSEFPPGTPPLRAHFPLRNRLISGLCQALIVVEARERSGSLISARLALSQGADVFVVPGPIDAATSLGSNRLLRDGAWPVLEAADVLEVLGSSLPVPAARSAPPGSHDPPQAGPIVAALERAPASRDELARVLGRIPESLALALLDLEIEGRVVRDRDGRFRLVP
jgi:DNA processing protein